MGLHLIFLVIYYILSQLYPGEVLIGAMVVHCVLNLRLNQKNIIRNLNLSMFYSFGIAIASIANVLFINKVKTFGVDSLQIYNFIDTRYINDASFIWVFGNTFVFMGYELFKNVSLPSIAVFFSDKKVLDNIFYVMISFTIMFYAGYNIDLSFIAGGFQKIILLLFSVGILFYSRLWVSENNNKYGIYAISLCVFQTIAALYSSYLRLAVINPVCILFLGYFVGKGNFKVLLTYRVIPFIVVFAVFLQFFQALGGHRAHFIQAFTNGDNENAAYTYVESDENKGGSFMDRSSCIAQLTNIVKLTKEKGGFYGGKASEPLIAALVPRIFWPNKPRIELGSWFALEIGAGSMGENGRVNNSVNMTIPGELYLDFDWYGVFIGCILWGGLLAIFWNAAHFNDSQFNLTGTLWGGYLLQGAIGAISDMQVIITLFSTYFVFLLIRKITDQYENSRRRPALEGQ